MSEVWPKVPSVTLDVEAEDQTDTPEEKRRFIKSVAALLTENQYAWEFGFWEYYNDAETSIHSFNQWRNELESSMATEPDEMGQEIDRLHRFSNQKEFLVVTIILLIDNRDEPIARRCLVTTVSDRRTANCPRPFDRSRKALKNPSTGRPQPSLNYSRVSANWYARIERDGIFVYPGTAQDGLSSLDLLGDPDWKYLTDHSFRLQ